MFWKKKQSVTTAAEPVAATPGGGAAVPQAAAKPVKVKKLSPQEELEGKIAALQSGEEVRYRLSDTFGGGLAVVTLNPKYPEKGRKYTLLTEVLTDGKPSGKRQYLWDYDKPRDLARWIFDRNGKPYEG